ncbi:hypothetical protein OF83DRAFT_1172302 [Amylostereum chailletii]|nr:hypothetical protein OF83DRAFT_1172302 [Amylostereum chailletii]
MVPRALMARKRKESAVQLYIAFYRIGNVGKYHWALVPSATGPPSLIKPTKIYQIVAEMHEAPDGRDVHRRWVTLNLSKELGKSGRFMGVLLLPPLDPATSLDDLTDFLDAQPPVPHGLCPDALSEWTCAKWIADILLEQGPIWGIDFAGRDATIDTLYYSIYILAHRLVDGKEGAKSGYEAVEGSGGLRMVRFPTAAM